MPEVEWTTLVDTMRHVEQLGLDDSGLLCFGDSPQGGIFVERGRICWVAAKGLQRRLRDLLRHDSKLEPGTLDRAYERCRTEGLLLGQTLVAQGLLQPGELQRALRRHSAECLAHLCQRSQPLSWASHVGRGYAPEFTFRAVDMLFDTVSLLHPELCSKARAELSRFEGPGRSGVAFTLDAELEPLLPVAQTGDRDLAALLGMARSALPIVAAGRELGTSPAFALGCAKDGSAIVVWSRDGVSFALACEDRASLAAATARHMVEM